MNRLRAFLVIVLCLLFCVSAHAELIMVNSPPPGTGITTAITPRDSGCIWMQIPALKSRVIRPKVR